MITLAYITSIACMLLALDFWLGDGNVDSLILAGACYGTSAVALSMAKDPYR